jgi:hypothetical protein
MAKKKRKAKRWVPADKLLSGKEFERFMKEPYVGRVFNAEGTHEILPDGTLVEVKKEDLWMVGE